MTSHSSVDAVELPEWFATALATTVEQATTSVEGAAIRYRAWGDPGENGLVLVHGGGAHSHWWDHIGPLLADGRRVVALDLSGHGDSDRRDAYSLETWGREVLAAATDAGIAAPPVVIGHSMGGLVTLRAAGLYAGTVSGVMVIDAPVRDTTPEERAAHEQRAFGPLRVYPSREAALARFRPIPDQPTLRYISAHIAGTSIREVAGGWSWKFDPHVFARPQLAPELLTPLDCRTALFRAEHGIMSPQTSMMMHNRLGRLAAVIEVPAASHHVMLDQPLALVTGIRALLSDWERTLPANACGR